MRQLDPVEQEQIKRIYAGEDVSSSDRPTDKARQRLKRLGMIKFDRAAKPPWQLTEVGKQLREARS